MKKKKQGKGVKKEQKSIDESENEDYRLRAIEKYQDIMDSQDECRILLSFFKI